MTQDKIIQMLHNIVAENQNYTTWTVSTPHLVELVNKAVKAEREACAKVAEQVGEHKNQHGISAAIRARGEA